MNRAQAADIRMKALRLGLGGLAAQALGIGAWALVDLGAAAAYAVVSALVLANLFGWLLLLGPVLLRLRVWWVWPLALGGKLALLGLLVVGVRSVLPLTRFGLASALTALMVTIILAGLAAGLPYAAARPEGHHDSGDDAPAGRASDSGSSARQ